MTTATEAAPAPADTSTPITVHVLAVLDVSGSMSRYAEDVRGGFNSYIERLRRDQADTVGNVHYKVSLTVFNDKYTPLCTAVDLPHVPVLNEDNYQPVGATALLDAIGRTIHAFEDRATLNPHDRVLLFIHTDGQENASTDFTLGGVNGMIDARVLGGLGAWQVVSAGAGPDAWRQNSTYSNSTQTVDTTHQGTRRVYDGLGGATIGYGRARGQSYSVGDTLRSAPGVADDTDSGGKK